MTQQNYSAAPEAGHSMRCKSQGRMPWPAFLSSDQVETVIMQFGFRVLFRTDQKYSSGSFSYGKKLKLQSDELQTIFRGKISTDFVVEQWVASQAAWQVGFHQTLPNLLHPLGSQNVRGITRPSFGAKPREPMIREAGERVFMVCCRCVFFQMLQSHSATLDTEQQSVLLVGFAF